jgi:tetratricopeptide (TPR) repeat protein
MLAKRIGIAWAGNDEARWNELVIAALGDDENSTDWWEWLEELAPAESRAERFDGLMAVFSIGTDPAKLREKWLARAWKAVEEAPAGEREILAARISTASLIAGDVAGSLKSWNLLSENSRAGIDQDQHIAHLTAAGRWADAAAVVLKRISDLSETKEDPRADLHSFAAALLRKAGRAEDAANHDQWADKLALGDPMLAVQIGTGYQLGGDHKRAAGWWARSAREAEPDVRAGMFSYAMELHAEVLLDEGRWKECAAVSEVITCMFATSEFDWRKFLLRFMHQRLHADMARAFANLKNDRAGSIAILDKLHRSFLTDGILADYFFPAVRKAGLIEKHDEWFESTWKTMEEVVRNYPEADNSRNTAAWFASRALRKLDEAEKHLAAALASNPDQSAYLDTMAEIQFAKGDRDKALEWSGIAINFDPEDSQLRRQHERFRTEPLPK